MEKNANFHFIFSKDAFNLPYSYLAHRVDADSMIMQKGILTVCDHYINIVELYYLFSVRSTKNPFHLH